MFNRSPIDGFLRVDTYGQVHIIGHTLRRRLANEHGRFRFSGSGQGTLTFDKASELRPIRELDTPILLSGSLEQIASIADIINLIAIARYDTHLVVMNETHRYTVSFIQGQIRSAHSTDPSNRLGEIIHRQGLLSREIIDRSLVESRSARRPIGNYLVEQAFISEDDLMRCIEHQVRVIFSCIVGQKAGDFYLTKIDAESYQPHVDLDPQRALLQALTAMDELQEFEKQLGRHQSIKLSADSDDTQPSVDKLRPLERLFLTLLAEPIATTEILQRHSGRKEDTLDALLRLTKLGLIELVREKAQPKTPEFVPLAQPLNVSQTQVLLGRVNEIFKRLYTTAKRRKQNSPLEGALSTFLQFYGYTELFAGVTHNEVGLLDEQRLLDNLTSIKTNEPRSEYLERALHELLHFALYASKDFLDRQELREMQHALAVLFSQTSRN